TRADQVAVSHLEDRIAGLVEKLGASDARFGHLEAIERGVAELLVQVEHQRHAGYGANPELPEVDALKREVLRTQDSLEAVHGTLGHVVDRLAMIETGVRSATGPVTSAASRMPAAPMRHLAEPASAPSPPLQASA